MKYIVGGIILTLLNWFIITMVIDWRLMTLPIPHFKKGNYPEAFLIKKENRMDIQNAYNCSAFSTAFLLRHFGIEAEGNDIYNKMPGKMKSGYVYQKGIRQYFSEQKMKTYYYRGNIDQLKREISKGIPVIAFIKVYADKEYLHYVPVVGYDKDHLYIAESLGELVNCTDSSYYNRRVSINDFKKLWKTGSIKMPLYSNTYITVRSV